MPAASTWKAPALSFTKPPSLLNSSIAFATIGSSTAPSCACVSFHWAFARCVAPAAVPDSRAKAPVALAVCSVSRASIACVVAALSASPVSPERPISAFCASMSAALMATPYFSIGSVSPRISEPSAPTASAVEPPNCAARSAPRPISSSVCGARSSAATPMFFSCAPKTAASSSYSDEARPTSVAAVFAKPWITSAVEP